MVSPSFLEKFAICWLLEGFRAPNDKKNLDPKRVEKHVVQFSFRRGFTKYVFVENGAIFSFSALGPPYRGRAHCKDLAVFRPKKVRTREKIEKHGENFIFFAV